MHLKLIHCLKGSLWIFSLCGLPHPKYFVMCSSVHSIQIGPHCNQIFALHVLGGGDIFRLSKYFDSFSNLTSIFLWLIIENPWYRKKNIVKEARSFFINKLWAFISLWQTAEAVLILAPTELYIPVLLLSLDQSSMAY